MKRLFGFIFLSVGLICIGGAIFKAPLGASGIFILGYFLPAGLITLVGISLLFLPSKRPPSD